MIKSLKSSCTTASKESSSAAADNDPITPFRNLAVSYKSTSSLRPLINQVLSQPKIYAGFADLLHMPHVSSLLSTNNNDSAFLRTLELFAYGVYDEYLQAKEGTYLPLTQLQLFKLKLLTALTVISSHPNSYVPYEVLYKSLHIESIRELEDLLMECVYANIVIGKCDQRNMCFVKVHTVSRDIRLDQVSDFIQTLQSWQNNTRSLLEIISDSGSRAAQSRMTDKEFWNRVDAKGLEVRKEGSNNIAAAVTLGRNHCASMDIGMDATVTSPMVSSPPIMTSNLEDSSAGNSRKASKRSRAGMGGSHVSGSASEFGMDSSTTSSYTRRE